MARPDMEVFMVATKCTNCGLISNKLITVGRSNLCESCYFPCHDCGEMINRAHDIFYTVQNENKDRTYYVCKKCFAIRHRMCNYCSSIRPRDTIKIYVKSGHGRIYYCEDCEKYVIFDKSVLKYNANPYHQHRYLRHEKNPFMFGFELEVECENRADTLQNFINCIKKKRLKTMFYFKHDGSLQNGFEIVTHPISYEYFKTNVGFKDIIHNLIGSFTFYDAKTCGLHFHTSKSYVGQEAYYKMLLFYSTNASPIISFSKRTEEQLNRYCRVVQFDKKRYARFLKQKLIDHDKYVAVRWCNDKKTIEHRIFRGTLNYDRFMASLEFVYALTLFVKQHSFMCLAKENSWDLFKKYIKREGRYRYLERALAGINNMTQRFKTEEDNRPAIERILTTREEDLNVCTNS